mmetsp:Transcript_20287/g.42438  ORF Transcript_20287/g.42438 Transcript_20287/m.42438 type:complete len:128 (-) Transcript_20287:468-851(-)
MTPFEVLEEVINHAVVEILTSQVGVTSRGLHLKDTLLDGEEGNIKGSTTKVENEDVLLIALLVQTIRDGRSSGLVDDTEHVESRNGTSVLGRLPLRVVKVRRHSDHSVLHLLAQVGLGNLTHLGEDH